MSKRIDYINNYDYTKVIGFCKSVGKFTSTRMEYLEVAISTEKIHVNATPHEFLIQEDGSEKIREYVISHMPHLVEISEELAINSPKYIMICYCDSTRRYFKHNEEFCEIYSMAKQYEPVEAVVDSEPMNDYVLNKSYQCDNQGGGVYTSKPITASMDKMPEPPSNDRIVSRSQKKEKSYAGAFLVVLLVITIFIVKGCISQKPQETVSVTHEEENVPMVAEPQSGEILAGVDVVDESQLTIKTSANEACLVKLKTITGMTRMIFYVRADDEVTVNVPAEDLYVYFASGENWYGEELLFGEETSYSKDDEVQDFKNYTCTYTLYSVTGGNFSETPIGADEF